MDLVSRDETRRLGSKGNFKKGFIINIRE